jgi:hypothetical protein
MRLLLVFAVTRDKPDVVRALLECGADDAICSPEGQTLYEMTQAQGHHHIAEMLKANAL